MSYDVTIGDAWFNYTSNVSMLFYDHIPPQEEGCRGGLHAPTMTVWPWVRLHDWCGDYARGGKDHG